MAASRENAVCEDLEDDEDGPSSQSPDEEEDDMDNNDALPVDEEDEDDEEEDDEIRSISTAGTSGVPIAVPSASALAIRAAAPNGIGSHGKPIPILPITTVSPNGPKRFRIVPPYEAIASPPHPQSQQDRKPQPADEARRLFQRLWTDEDEIELLRGFQEYTSQRGGGGSHLDNGLFYDQIKSKLQLDFNKNQLVEKLRRLKKKYRNVISKINSGKEFSFKSPHDLATFEISKKIWSTSFSSANLDDEDGDTKSLDDHPNRVTNFSNSSTPRKRFRYGSKPGPPTPFTTPSSAKVDTNADHLYENTSHNRGVKSFGLSDDLLGGGATSISSAGISGLLFNSMPLGFGLCAPDSTLLADDRWKKQQILELEVYSKRLELLQEQIHEHLNELRSSRGGP